MLISGDNRWISETRSAWSRFVIGVHLRHPDTIPELRAAATSVWANDDEIKRQSQRQYELIRKPTDPITFDERIAEIDPLVAVKVELNTIMKLIDNEKICGQINNMVWDVIDVSAATRDLLTSDRPVILSKLKERDGSIMMPISPAKLFVAVNHARWLSYLKSVRPRDIVGPANRQTIERARRYVWAQDTSQEGFIRKHMEKKLEPPPLFPTSGPGSLPSRVKALRSSKAGPCGRRRVKAAMQAAER
jgi:hypothetical protein